MTLQGGRERNECLPRAHSDHLGRSPTMTAKTSFLPSREIVAIDSRSSGYVKYRFSNAKVSFRVPPNSII